MTATLGQEIARIAEAIEDPDDFYIHHVGMGKRLTLWFKGDGRDAALASQMLAFMREARKQLAARYRAPIIAELKSAYLDLGIRSVARYGSLYFTSKFLSEEHLTCGKDILQELPGVEILSKLPQNVADALVVQIRTLCSLLDSLDKALTQVDAAISEFDKSVIGSTIMQRVTRRDERIAALAGLTAEGIHYTSHLRNAVLEISGRLKAIADVA